MFGRKGKSRDQTTIRIAVCGSWHHIGTTCLCIALSNYLCSRHRRKTAYVEMNAAGEILGISDPHNGPFFQKLGVHYYTQASLPDLPLIESSGYDCLIIDFGVLNPRTLSAFIRCDRKLVICDFSLWKRAKLEDFFRRNTFLFGSKGLTLLGNSRDFHLLADAQDFSPAPVLFLPDIRNPFQITSDQFEIFEKILNGD